MIALSRLYMIILTPLLFISGFAWSQYWPCTIPTQDYNASQPLRETIYRGEYTPTAGEGITQLLNRLGETANQIETKVQNLPDISELLELEYVQLHCATMLYARDFETTGTIIDAPGYYILCDDIDFSAAGNAITVRSGHVTIDLNRHTIYATGSASNGIYIDSSTTALHNIVVKNGTIAKFATSGLQINSSSAPGFSNMQLDSVKFENNGQYDIFLNGSSSNTISNCRISNCSSIGSTVGIYLNWAQDCTVVYSNFTNNSNAGAQTIGSVTKCYFDRCTFNDNGSYGFSILSDSRTCIWNDCIFNNNPAGIEFNSSYSHTVFMLKNCIANNNTDGNGFDITNGNGGILTNCTAMNNSGQNECSGIRLTDCSNCLMENCVSSANKNNSDSDVCYGILLRQSSGPSENNVLIQCTADSNSNAGTAGSVGIEIDENVKNTVVSGCSAFSNSGTGNSGITNNNTDLTNPTIIIGCVAGNNSTNFGGILSAHYARRDRLGSHWQTGAQENIALETDGVNDVGCVIYLDQDAFPLTITQPGHYILCEDIALNSGDAVTIDADFVMLDLNGKSISGSFTDGVIINHDHHDIVIKNGNLAGFSNTGILLNYGCYHIDIENLNISNTSCAYGMQFVGFGSAGIHDCSIKNCKLTELTTTGNVWHGIYCYDIQVLNSHFNSNLAQNIIRLENSKKTRFIECQLNDNELAGDTVMYVLNLQNTDSAIFDCCTFNTNQSTQSNQGFDCIYFYNAHGSVIKNCIFNNNSSQRNFSALNFQSNSSGNTVQSCLISDNIGLNNARGIALLSPNNLIERCLIQAISGENAAFGIGIVASFGGSANNNSILTTDIFDVESGGNAYGINIISNTVKNTLVKGCLLFNNTTYGLKNNGTDSIIIGCAAGNNGTNYDGTTALSLHMTGTDVAQTVYNYDNVEFVL